MARETGVQSQVESYQRLKKWYLMPPFLTLSNIRYVWRVKWSNPETGVAPSPTPWCSSYRKGSLQVTCNYSRKLYLRRLQVFCFVFINISPGLLLSIVWCVYIKKCQLLFLWGFQINSNCWFSWKIEWQQVSSAPPVSFQYSSLSHQWLNSNFLSRQSWKRNSVL